MSVYKSTLTVLNQCESLAEKITYSINGVKKVYTIGAVPRGGIPVLYATYAFLDKTKFQVINDYLKADIIIDDIIDSGETKKRIMMDAPNALFFTLDVKPKVYIDYPWEVTNTTGDSSESVKDNYVRLLQFYGKEASTENIEILECILSDAIDSLS